MIKLDPSHLLELFIPQRAKLEQEIVNKASLEFRSILSSEQFDSIENEFKQKNTSDSSLLEAKEVMKLDCSIVSST